MKKAPGSRSHPSCCYPEQQNKLSPDIPARR